MTKVKNKGARRTGEFLPSEDVETLNQLTTQVAELTTKVESLTGDLAIYSETYEENLKELKAAEAELAAAKDRVAKLEVDLKKSVRDLKKKSFALTTERILTANVPEELTRRAQAIVALMLDNQSELQRDVPNGDVVRQRSTDIVAMRKALVAEVAKLKVAPATATTTTPDTAAKDAEIARLTQELAAKDAGFQQTLDSLEATYNEDLAEKDKRIAELEAAVAPAPATTPDLAAKDAEIADLKRLIGQKDEGFKKILDGVRDKRIAELEAAVALALATTPDPAATPDPATGTPPEDPDAVKTSKFTGDTKDPTIIDVTPETPAPAPASEATPASAPTSAPASEAAKQGLPDWSVPVIIGGMFLAAIIFVLYTIFGG